MKAGQIVPRLRTFLPNELRDAQRRLSRRAHADRTIHEVRKSIKKMRAALRLAAHMAPEKALLAVGAPLRAAAHALGPLRDHLVLAETARAIVRRGDRPLPVRAAPPTSPILKQARASLQKATGAMSLLLQEGFDPKGAEKGLRVIYKRARREMKQAAKTASDDDLHAWRRRSKDLYYVAEWIGAPARWVKKLNRLTRLLGDDHDLATFMAHHRSTADLEDQAHLLKRVKKRRAPLQKKALRLGAAIFEGKASDFVCRASFR